MIAPETLTPEEIAALDSVQDGTSPDDTPKRRGRKPGSTNKQPRDNITKQALYDMLSMFSASATMASLSVMPDAKYAQLDSEEIQALTDAWYPVLTAYPGVMRQMAKGNKLTKFGRAIFTTAMIAERKYRLYALDHQTGATRPDSGDERVGQDYVSASANGFGPVPTHN